MADIVAGVKKPSSPIPAKIPELVGAMLAAMGEARIAGEPRLDLRRDADWIERAREDARALSESHSEDELQELIARLEWRHGGRVEATR